jgi:hypothetical protein
VLLRRRSYALPAAPSMKGVARRDCCQNRDRLFAGTESRAFHVHTSQKSSWCQAAATRRNIMYRRRQFVRDFHPPTSGESDEKFEDFIEGANFPGAWQASWNYEAFQPMEGPLVARLRHADPSHESQLSGVKRKFCAQSISVANDPKATLQSGLNVLSASLVQN